MAVGSSCHQESWECRGQSGGLRRMCSFHLSQGPVARRQGDDVPMGIRGHGQELRARGRSCAESGRQGRREGCCWEGLGQWVAGEGQAVRIWLGLQVSK